MAYPKGLFPDTLKVFLPLLIDQLLSIFNIHHGIFVRIHLVIHVGRGTQRNCRHDSVTYIQHPRGKLSYLIFIPCCVISYRFSVGLKLGHKGDLLIDASIVSSLLPSSTTSNVCLQSPPASGFTFCFHDVS